MTSASAAAWRAPSDVQTLGSQEAWNAMAERMAQAADQDAARVNNLFQSLEEKLTAMIQVVGQKHHQGLNAKDLKPEKYNSKDVCQQSYRQWADDLATWLNMVEPRAAKLRKVVNDLAEWNTLTCNARAAEEGLLASEVNTVKEGLLMVLKKFTEGEARTIVDTCDDGAEALYRLNARSG